MKKILIAIIDNNKEDCFVLAIKIRNDINKLFKNIKEDTIFLIDNLEDYNTFTNNFTDYNLNIDCDMYYLDFINYNKLLLLLNDEDSIIITDMNLFFKLFFKEISNFKLFQLDFIEN